MKTQLKWIAFWLAALTLVGMVLLAGSAPVSAAPLLQMTPGVDPMLTPTVVAPALDTQSGLPGASTGTTMGSGQASCPMMSGTTGTSSGTTGMSSMPGMSGMPGMGNMSGSMPMTGPMVMSDALSSQQAGFLNSTNPWWLVGWIIVFILVIALLVFLGLGMIWMARQLRKEKPAASV